MEELSEDLVHLILRVEKGLHASIFRAVAAPEGLGRPEFGLLGHLHARGPSCLSEAAESLHMAKSQLSLVVERLETQGLVERLGEGKDRRVVRIRSTAEGEAAFRQAAEGLRSRLGELFAPLGEGELAVIDQAFELLSTLIGGKARRGKC